MSAPYSTTDAEAHWPHDQDGLFRCCGVEPEPDAVSWPPSSDELAAFRRAIDPRAWYVVQVRPCGAMAHEIAHGIGAQDADAIGLAIGGGWLDTTAGEVWAGCLSGADYLREKAAITDRIERATLDELGRLHSPDCSSATCGDGRVGCWADIEPAS